MPLSQTEIQYLRVYPWFCDKGEHTLRENYPLHPDAIVFDLGGFKGEWSERIYDKYACHIFIFEPYKPFFMEIAKKFKDNPKVRCFEFGLGSQNATVPFSADGLASGIFAKGSENAGEFISIKSTSEFFTSHNIETIDLIKINIEGAEYDFMDDVIERGLHKMMKNIQIQFHDFVVPNAKIRMDNIKDKLRHTHYLTYEYEFVWENWRLREP